MARRIAVLLLAVLGIGGLSTGCGDDPPAAPGTDAGCAVAKVAPWNSTSPMQGIYWAQEIWIGWRPKDADPKVWHWPRTKDEALELARGLCADVRSGKDIGALAREHSNGNGGVARGIAVVPEPSHRSKPDARDVTLFRAAVGELTPLIEWNNGYWFARRISDVAGRKLMEELRRASLLRARARVIQIFHREAFPYRYEFDEVTEEGATKAAWAFIRQIEHAMKLDELAGLPKFIEIAKKYSNDDSFAARSRGGLIRTKHPRTGEKTEWVRWGDRAFPQALLRVILEKCPPGKLWPQPVITARGVSVVWVLERTTKPE